MAPDEDAIFQIFCEFVAQASRKQALVTTLAAAGIDVQALITSSGRGVRAAVARLLTRAQEAGIVRADVGVGEVLGLLIGVAHAAEQGAWDTRMRKRTLRVIFDGLRR